MGRRQTASGTRGHRMLYLAYQLQSDIMTPIRAWATIAAATGQPFLADNQTVRSLTAAYELIARAGLTHSRPPFGISSVTVGNREVEVREEAAYATPFGTLLHFKKDIATAQPRVLLVAPLSGHFATLLRATVRTMLPEHDVFITDWHNARDAPLTAGRFGVDEYVEHLIKFLEVMGQGAHVVAVCQPCVAVLAAAAVMAQAGNPAQPRSMTLMAGPIDTRVNPTKVNVLAQERSIEWFERTLIASVPIRYPGAFRRVYPGFVQLIAFMSMNIERHVKAHHELYENLSQWRDREGGDHQGVLRRILRRARPHRRILSGNGAADLPGARAAARQARIPRRPRRPERDPPHHAAHRRRRARRHLRRRPDRRRARPLQQAAPVSQAPPHAGRRRPLRRVLRQALGEPSLSDFEECDPVERLRWRDGEVISASACCGDLRKQMGKFRRAARRELERVSQRLACKRRSRFGQRRHLRASWCQSGRRIGNIFNFPIGR